MTRFLFRKELQFQEEKNLELSIKLTKTTNELSTFQQKLVLIQKEHQSAIQNIQLSLLNEKTIRNTLEEECHTKTKVYVIIYYSTMLNGLLLGITKCFTRNSIKDDNHLK